MAQTGAGAYTPSADRLVTWTEYLIAVRDATGRARGSVFPIGNEQATLPVGPDGRTILALASDRTACLWEISAEAEPVPDKQATVKESSPSRRDLNIFEADLRADGQIAVSQSRDAARREQIRLADPATGRPLGAPARHHPGWEVRSLAFSPDGRSFATGSDPHHIPTGELRLWDTSTGRLLFPPIPYTNFVSAIGMVQTRVTVDEAVFALDAAGEAAEALYIEGSFQPLFRTEPQPCASYLTLLPATVLPLQPR